MSEKKGVNQTVAIALGLVCIVLAAGLVVVLANGSPIADSQDQQTIADLQQQLTNRTNTIATLNAQIASLQNQLNNVNHNNTQYEEEIAELEEQIQEYINILHLNKTATLVNNQTLTQNPNSTLVVWNDDLYYAGYAKVTVESSSNTTYVQVIYNYGNVHYNQTVTVGASGTVYFPVLPSEVGIIIGNNESTNDVTATVTATYYY
jgi:TolA-binding protein